MKNQPDVNAHLPVLDGIRGLAMLGVLAFHASESFELYRHGLSGFLVGMVPILGTTSVDCFFVLSGFLITKILLRGKSEKRSLRKFFIRRILRIFPVYYSFLLVFLFVLPLFSPGDVFNAHCGELSVQQGWFWLYLQNLWMANRGSMPPCNTMHLWSLAIEEQYYLLWPLVIYLCPIKQLPKLCVAVVLGSLFARYWFAEHGASSLTLHTHPLCRLDGLACGSLLAVLLLNGSWSKALAWAKPLAAISFISLLGIGLLIVQSRALVPAPNLLVPAYLAMATLYSGVITLALVDGSIFFRLFNRPFFKFVGKYSYAVYVWHYPFIGLLSFYAVDRAMITFFGSSPIAYIVFFLLSAVGSIAIGLLSWHLIEKWPARIKERYR